MKELRTLKYTISLLLLLLCAFTGVAQTKTDSISTKSDTTKTRIKRAYGLRVGADVSKLVRSFLDDKYKGFELVGDYRITQNLYVAGELGTEERQTLTDYMDITTKGNYFKAGVDYNVYENWLDMDNMIYGGFRIGASTFNHTLHSYTTYSEQHYWGDPFTSNEAQEFNGLTALWAECIAGIKVEVLNNLYLGANIQFKFLLTETVPDNFENVYIPGFNKTYDSGRFGVGFGYNISYLIPLYKKGN